MGGQFSNLESFLFTRSYQSTTKADSTSNAMGQSIVQGQEMGAVSMFYRLCKFVALTFMLLAPASAYASTAHPHPNRHHKPVVHASAFKGVQGSTLATSATTVQQRRPYHRPHHGIITPHHSTHVEYAATAPPTSAQDAPVVDLATRSEDCLAQAIYREAKSENLQGQAAVGYVVTNRTTAHGFPDSVCGVVYQRFKDHAGVNHCQFSWSCRATPGRINAWQMTQAHQIAQGVLNRTIPNPIGDALYFHESCFSQRPSRSAPFHLVLGHQIFFSPTPIVHAPELALAEQSSIHQL